MKSVRAIGRFFFNTGSFNKTKIKIVNRYAHTKFQRLLLFSPALSTMNCPTSFFVRAFIQLHYLSSLNRKYAQSMFLENFPSTDLGHGWIEVICGSMFSGKTEELIRRMRRAQFAQQPLIIFKPRIDNRYSSEEVVTHRGERIPAMVVNHSAELLECWDKQKVVGIDEVQFFDEGILDVCVELAKRGVRVICAGLDMDFSGNPFGAVPKLLAVAEYITKVHAICVSCGSLAQFSHRLVNEKNQVLLGEKDRYEPLCRKCFNDKMASK
jgi:thymidine kinase